MPTVRKFYNVRHVDTIDLPAEHLAAVEELIGKGDDESLAQVDEILGANGTFIGTDDGDIDPSNEMLDFFVEA